MLVLTVESRERRIAERCRRILDESMVSCGHDGIVVGSFQWLNEARNTNLQICPTFKDWSAQHTTWKMHSDLLHRPK
jgi:hypothetical protein